MKPLDPCVIDTSIWIEAQRNPRWFAGLIADLPDIATCFTAAGEYAVGCYAAEQKKTRDEARDFFENSVQAVACHPHLPDDFLTASRLIGQAIFSKTAKPNYADGLIAACARRLDRVVWSKDEGHFSALGCRVYNPLKDTPVQTSR